MWTMPKHISIEISTCLKRLAVVVCLLACAGDSQADVYPIEISYLRNGQHVEESGTAVCVGSSEGRSTLLTAGHVVADRPGSVWVSNRREWIAARQTFVHPTADLAIVEVDAALNVTPISDRTPAGAQVLVAGYGPALNRSGESFGFRATLTSDSTLRGEDGEHVIPGDSGGPVLCDTEQGPTVIGIVTHYVDERPAATRHDLRGTETGFVPAETLVAFIQTQYGRRCPPGGCPIRIRPQIQQPMIGIGIPVGPPKIVDTIEPAPVRLAPQTIYQQGPAGPAGPPGPQGPAGKNVNQEQVEAVVNAWLDANRDQLRGPAGPPGPPGPAGAAGAAGHSPGVSGLEKRLSDLERRPFRIVLSSDGKIVDDETYAPGEPVVLDLKRLRSMSDAR
jgi:hypothetical protein